MHQTVLSCQPIPVHLVCTDMHNLKPERDCALDARYRLWSSLFGTVAKQQDLQACDDSKLTVQYAFGSPRNCVELLH